MPYEITDEEIAGALNKKAENGKRGADGYEDAKLLQYLDDLREDLGEFPNPGDVSERNQYSVTTYYNHFGDSWRKVRVAYDRWK